MESTRISAVHSAHKGEEVSGSRRPTDSKNAGLPTVETSRIFIYTHFKRDYVQMMDSRPFMHRPLEKKDRLPCPLSAAIQWRPTWLRPIDTRIANENPMLFLESFRDGGPSLDNPEPLEFSEKEFRVHGLWAYGWAAFASLVTTELDVTTTRAYR